MYKSQAAVRSLFDASCHQNVHIFTDSSVKKNSHTHICTANVIRLAFTLCREWLLWWMFAIFAAFAASQFPLLCYIAWNNFLLTVFLLCYGSVFLRSYYLCQHSMENWIIRAPMPAEHIQTRPNMHTCCVELSLDVGTQKLPADDITSATLFRVRNRKKGRLNSKWIVLPASIQKCICLVAGAKSKLPHGFTKCVCVGAKL